MYLPVNNKRRYQVSILLPAPFSLYIQRIIKSDTPEHAIERFRQDHKKMLKNTDVKFKVDEL
jgi:hypothetical protein